MFIVKEHETEDSKLLAIVDKNILRKEIIEENKILNLKSNFYDGNEKTEDEIINLISRATHLNIVGNQIVDLLKKKNIIENYLVIGGIKYAQAILIRE